MTTLFTYVRDDDTDLPYFGVVADDNGAEYVWRKGASPWWPSMESRLDTILVADEEEPSTAEGWLELATRNLGDYVSTDPPFDDASTAAEAKKLAQGYLESLADPGDATQRSASVLSGVPEAFEQVAADYPGFGDDDESLLEQPGALDNMVLMALGPIDPEGPNGWILRALDGNPAPGDENEYIHWPGGPANPEEEGDT